MFPQQAIPAYKVGCTEPVQTPMPFAAIVQRIRSFSLSIGQLTFGSFLLLLAAITATSMASVIAIRHIDATFAELQRLQDVGDLAEEIDRRMNELRLAARDVVTDPNAHTERVSEAASTLSALLKKTRLELAPEQQQMIDGVAAAAANYRDGIERVTALISRRAELVAALPPVRERFESAIAEVPDRAAARQLVPGPEPGRGGLAGARPRMAAERAAERMRALPIDDPALRSAAEAYADAIISISRTEAEIAKLDKEVLGTEGQQIGRVTELLRDLSARRGRELSNDFARTLSDDKWQSIILGIAGVLIGLIAALFVVRRTVRPLKSIAGAIRALAGGEKTCLDSRNRRRQRDRRHRARRRGVSPLAGRCRRGARGGHPRAWPSSGWPRKAIASCSKARLTGFM